jgi:hypothetical protein
VSDAKAPGRLVQFVVRWEMAFHLSTVAIFILALALVVVLFPDVSNLWVSIFVLVGTLTASVSAMIGAIKSRVKE